MKNERRIRHVIPLIIASVAFGCHKEPPERSCVRDNVEMVCPSEISQARLYATCVATFPGEQPWLSNNGGGIYQSGEVFEGARISSITRISSTRFEIVFTHLEFSSRLALPNCF